LLAPLVQLVRADRSASLELVKALVLAAVVLNAGASLGLVAESRAVSASRRHLEDCIPDLRQVVRTAAGEPLEAPAPAVEQTTDESAAGFGLSGPVTYADDGQAIPSTAA
jgi:hypothetical protein